jgi:predicted MFS family arabinose efflux permease
MNAPAALATMAASRPRTAWPLVAALIATGVVGSAQIGKVPVALPALQASFGVSLAAAAWVLSVFTLLGVVLGIVTGTVAERVGSRRVVIAGEAAFVLGGLISAAAPNFTVMLAGRIVEGFGFLCTSVGIPALLRELAAPRDRAMVLGLWSVYMPFGVAAGVAGGPFLITAFGWRVLWLVGVGLAAVCGLGLAAALPPARVARGPRPAALRADVWRVVTTPQVVIYGFVFGGQALTWFAVAGFLPVLLIDRLHVPLGAAGLMTAAVTFASAIGNVAASLLRRWGMTVWAVIVIAMAIQVPLVFGIFSDTAPPLLSYGFAFLFVILGGCLPAVTFGGATAQAPEPRLTPLVLGLLTQFSCLGQLAGPAIVGTVVERGGWSAAIAPVVAVVALVLVLGLGLRRLSRAEPATA